jgi:Cobalamin biosynthesis protein CobN and related Mg-chelatases
VTAAGQRRPDGAAAGRPTNSGRHRHGGEKLSLAAYEDFLSRLPARAREQVKRAGAAGGRSLLQCRGLRAADPSLRQHRRRRPAARGYNIDPASSYHSPDLVPPHGYLAFYAWLREDFQAHAIVHMGKHGNLEWLPGRPWRCRRNAGRKRAGTSAASLSLHRQRPRRGQPGQAPGRGVIVDHLTPPLTRAETYGPLADLERLVDEYYEASGLDPRRCNLLRQQILELARSSGLDKDCGIAAAEEAAPRWASWMPISAI